jgi:hypothetical protein
VRAVRFGSSAGGSQHHVITRALHGEAGEPGRAMSARRGGAMASSGPLMEWAIGKSFMTRIAPIPASRCLPLAHLVELHLLHAVGEIRDHAELAVYFYPKGQSRSIGLISDIQRHVNVGAR